MKTYKELEASCQLRLPQYTEYVMGVDLANNSESQLVVVGVFDEEKVIFAQNRKESADDFINRIKDFLASVPNKFNGKEVLENHQKKCDEYIEKYNYWGRKRNKIRG